jgi:hypothetical protein
MHPEVDKAVLSKSKEDVNLLEYDYFKHLSTLSLVALGGILSLSPSQTKIAQNALLAATLCVAIGGATALLCLEQIIISQRNNRPLSKAYRFSRSIAAAMFSVGIGIFLVIFFRLYT